VPTCCGSQGSILARCAHLRVAALTSPPCGGSALSLPFPGRCAAPGEAVVVTRWPSGDDDVMPHQWNTRTTVEVPELFVCGLLHASKRPAWLGSAAFSRATLSNNSWLSSADRFGPRDPRNGMTWACATVGRRTQTASAAAKHRNNRGRIQLSSPPRRHPAPAGTGARQARHQPESRRSLLMGPL